MNATRPISSVPADDAIVEESVVLPSHRTRFALALAALAVGAAWALLPMRGEPPLDLPPERSLESPVPPRIESPPTLNLAAFRAPIWVAPPPPPPTVLATNTPVPPPPPFTAQLLAIARVPSLSGSTSAGPDDRAATRSAGPVVADSEWEAIFYDAGPGARDVLLHVRAGNVISGRTIRRVLPDRVILAEPSHNTSGGSSGERVLQLREPTQPILGLLRVNGESSRAPSAAAGATR